MEIARYCEGESRLRPPCGSILGRYAIIAIELFIRTAADYRIVGGKLLSSFAGDAHDIFTGKYKAKGEGRKATRRRRIDGLF